MALVTSDGRSTLGFLAGELRRARSAAGLSQGQLAEAIAYSESLVAMVETGRRTPSKDFTGRCDEALHTGGLLTRILNEVVSREFAPDWFRPWISLEREATELRAYHCDLVPGLLQTPDYARAVLCAGGSTDDELDQHLAARLERQAILRREPALLFVAVIDEIVLRRPIGGPSVMREQVLHLVDASERGVVRLQIVPLSAGMYRGLDGAFVLATFGGDGDMIYLENAIRGQVVENPTDVAGFRRVWEELRCEALPRTQSVTMLREAAAAWTD